jgi:hypothetical protein
VGKVQRERLTIRRTATGYWVVQRGGVQLAGCLTRQAAEAERNLLERLRDRSPRRSSLRQRARSRS